MPKVTIYQGGAITPTGFEPQRFDPVQGAPSGLQQGLEAGAEVLKTQDVVNNEVDEANAKHLYNQYVTQSDSILHENGLNGSDPYYSLTGKSALDARPAVERSLDDARSGLLNQTATPRQRLMLQQALEPRVQEDMKGIGSHAVEQSIRYNSDESQSRISLLSADATHNYLDPKITEGNIVGIQDEVANLGRINHWGPDHTASTALRAVSGARTDIATRFVYGSPQGPVIAQAYVDAHPDEFTPADRQTVDNHIRVQQRRLEVEAHQGLSQQREDAKTFIHNIQQRVESRIPVPAADFQQAQGLLARPELKLEGEGFDLGKAQTTDQVNRIYQNATPQTISARVDVLNAEIAKRGDKVDPTHVIERNVLATMLPQKRDEIRNDPLAIYAQGGGQITPINWSDPATLGTRLGQAKMAQGRLGGMLTVLTQDEAATLEQELAKGNAAGRVDVVNRLSAGGPEFAVAAARQIAPGNQHLQTAAALATMGPQGRAAARDSLLGSDAIAAHKGLVNEPAAQQVFGRFSQALTGLTPDAQHGIYDTAMGIFATRQARAGQLDLWPKLGDNAQRTAFMAALQTALGATKRPTGEVAGGAGTHNGMWTLLPTTMTQREFETTIARATPTDFARAAGGVTPVYANHKAPSPAEFKAMRFEAVGDGIYRVKLGNAFLARGDNKGIYEFDANKLRH